MSRSTVIATRLVPLLDGELVTLQFSGGRGGEDEAGLWEFWAAIDAEAALTARCRVGSDPGERFRRMEHATGYEQPWAHASRCVALRPSSLKEVLGWLKGHRDDAQFVLSGTVGDRQLAVLRHADGLKLEVV